MINPFHFWKYLIYFSYETYLPTYARNIREGKQRKAHSFKPVWKDVAKVLTKVCAHVLLQLKKDLFFYLSFSPSAAGLGCNVAGYLSIYKTLLLWADERTTNVNITIIKYFVHQFIPTMGKVYTNS